ncbi:hypothetical protein WJX84_008311 [Apatococcus fuscideae]|uniref:F-box domain-containing protein n=1 Tax=Apatococcus fuscideae TaxID=2026836 RepID=A0AAW1TAD6_9CHLO
MTARCTEEDLADELLLALDETPSPGLASQVRPAPRKGPARPGPEEVPQRHCAPPRDFTDAPEPTPLPQGLNPTSAGVLCQFPTEVFMRVLACLSAEELILLTQVNSFFAKVGSDPILWKRLCTLRWKGSQDTDGNSRGTTWKAVYLAKDGAELGEKVEGAPEAMKIFLRQSIVGRRSERPSHRVSCGEEILRHARPAHMGPQRPHTCLGPVTFRHVGGNCVACTVCGWVHVCDENCRERLIDRQSHLPVCPLSGRCFDRLMTEQEEDEADLGPPCDRDPGEDGIYGGRLAVSAYLAGYNSHSLCAIAPSSVYPSLQAKWRKEREWLER